MSSLPVLKPVEVIRKLRAEALAKWAKEHQGQFYKILAKILPKETHGTLDVHPHEDFIRYLQEEEAKKLAGAGEPVMMIECDADEIPKEEKGKKKQTPPIKVLPKP